MDNAARRLAVDHGYTGPAWLELGDLSVDFQDLHHVHCAVPGCGAQIRNLLICRRQHIRMHERASARISKFKVRQVEVARRAGLDVSSVNKILNGVRGPKFRDETVRKVQAIAKRLGYQPPKKGKKAQADSARALIWGARYLIERVSGLPLAASQDLTIPILALESIIESALEIWPEAKPAPVRPAEKAVQA